MPTIHRHLDDELQVLRDLLMDVTALDGWLPRWRARLGADSLRRMDAANPVYIPRNHLVEQALTAATGGDLDPLHGLLEVLARPFDERPGLERYTEPAPEAFGAYVTYCGT